MIENIESRKQKGGRTFRSNAHREGKERYLGTCLSIKTIAFQTAKGFIRSERFSSLNAESKLLSLNVWESEEAVEKWRNELNQSHEPVRRT